MSNPPTTNNTRASGTTAAAEAAPAPVHGPADVAAAIAQVVQMVGHLPAALQLRALGGAATALGLDKDQRSKTSQQTTRSTSSSNQNRNGSR